MRAALFKVFWQGLLEVREELHYALSGGYVQAPTGPTNVVHAWDPTMPMFDLGLIGVVAIVDVDFKVDIGAE